MLLEQYKPREIAFNLIITLLIIIISYHKRKSWKRVRSGMRNKVSNTHTTLFCCNGEYKFSVFNFVSVDYLRLLFYKLITLSYIYLTDGGGG